MMALRDYSDQACIAGVGATPQGSLPEHSGDDLAIWAFRLALEDCGLRKDNVDGLIVQSSFGGQGGVTEIGRRLGLEPRVAMGGLMGGQALQVATLLVHSGMCSYVACVYGTNQKTNRNRFAGSVFRPGGNFGEVYGLSNPGAVAAFNYRRRMHDYGATEEQLGAIAVAQSKGAAMNPLAVFRSPLTLEDYLESRYVIAPLRLVDFCMISDGGFAVIVTSPERAKDLGKRPVYIAGMGSQASFLEYDHPEAMYHPTQPPNARMLWESSGFRAQDMDALYVQDAYTPNLLAALENYGFCELGTAHEWVQDGRIQLGGELPANVNGGQNRMTYMLGWQNTDDAVRQLRGEAEEPARQIPGVERILCTYSTGLWEQTWSVVLRS